jgi:hypothetical protein
MLSWNAISSALVVDGISTGKLTFRERKSQKLILFRSKKSRSTFVIKPDEELNLSLLHRLVFTMRARGRG